jgi:hypothetical protein
LSLKEMQIDRSPFSVNKLDLENPAVLIWPEQADTTKGKNVVVNDPRPESDAGPTPSLKVVMEKLPGGEEIITITLRGSTTGRHEKKVEGLTSARKDRKRKPTAANPEQVVRPPPDRSDGHDWPERATPHYGQTARRAGPTATRDGTTARKVGQTTPLRRGLLG